MDSTKDKNRLIIYDVMNPTGTFLTPGLLIQIDFEKVFYSAGCDVILQSLDVFGFDPKIQK